MNQNERSFFVFFPTSFLLGSEEWSENNLQVSRRLRLLRRTDLLEAAVALSRHGTAAEVQIRHRRQSTERHQRGDGRDGAGGPSPPQPESSHHRSGLPGGLPQLLPALQVLAGHRGEVVRQRHELPEFMLWTRLQHGHAPHQPVLPLPGALVLPCGVSDVREGGGEVYLQKRLTDLGRQKEKTKGLSSVCWLACSIRRNIGV